MRSWLGRFWPWQMTVYPPPAPPPVPPPPAPGAFAGIGLWTAWDARAAFHQPALAAWIAIRPDLCPLAVAVELRQHARLIVWEAEAREGQAAVDRFQASAYIAQAEGPGQIEAALRVGETVTAPKALVGSGPWPAGWTPLLECYQVVVPSDLGPGFPVLGVFDGFPLANYVESLAGRRDFSVYLAEEMTDGDWTVLATLAAS